MGEKRTGERRFTAGVVSFRFTIEEFEPISATIKVHTMKLLKNTYESSRE
jgi:hypothetical protein